MKRLLVASICVILCFCLISCSQGGNNATPQKNASLVITYSARITSNNSVGSDWGHGLKYNGETIKNGSRITQSATAKVVLTAFATEFDDSKNDNGSTNVTFDCLEVGAKKTKEVTVTVRENGGRYSGNTAKWAFVITIERIS